MFISFTVKPNLNRRIVDYKVLYVFEESRSSGVYWHLTLMNNEETLGLLSHTFPVILDSILIKYY